MDFDYTQDFIDEVKGSLKRPGSSGGTNGKDGKDGFSPTIKENKNNTADDYRFDVVNKNGTFTTPNLIGKDGKTPTIMIGANNNWFVNGVDTGVKAKGEKGDTGSGFNTTRQYSSVSDMMADTNPANDSEIVVVVLGDVGNFYMRLSSYIDPDGATNGYLPIGSAQDISTIKGEPGKDGTDGLTPHIDSATKHWFIGTTDTGIKAEGADGIDGEGGVTPHIDTTTKHWFIGDTDTGVKAEGKDGKDGVNGVDGADGIDGTNVTVTEFSGNNGRVYKLIIQDINGQIITPNLLGINGGGDTPVGHILSYMGINAPEHYLVCDGTVYNISDYPELANHFEREFGSSNFFGGDGTTTFAVPDLRGEFLRGTGTATRNTGTGASVGVHQDATEHINFGVNTNDKSIWFDTSTPRSGTNQVAIGKTDRDLKLTTSTNTTGLYADLTTWSGSTNYSHFTSRPTNTSVLYCIKCESTEQKDIYSTNEIEVGTWVDGKTIYRKVISFNLGETIQDAATVNTIDNIPNISAIIGVKGYIKWTKNNMYSGTVNIPYTHLEGTGFDQIFNIYNHDNGDIKFAYFLKTLAFDNQDAQIVIEYTKTTDV